MPKGDIKLTTPSNMLTALQQHGINFILSHGAGNVIGRNGIPSIDQPSTGLPFGDSGRLSLTMASLPEKCKF